MELVRFIPKNISIGSYRSVAHEHLLDLGLFLSSLVFINCSEEVHLMAPIGGRGVIR